MKVNAQQMNTVIGGGQAGRLEIMSRAFVFEYSHDVLRASSILVLQGSPNSLR